MKWCYEWLAAALFFAAMSSAISPQAALAATSTAGTAGELVSAITSANADPAADTIMLTANISLTAAAESDAAYGDSGLPAITSNITIEGQGYSITRNGSAPNLRILHVASAGILTLYNLTISGGIATIGTVCYGGDICGSGLYNEGTLTLSNTTVTANTIAAGAGLFVDGGSVNISNSTFSNNSNNGKGGGIFMRDGSLNIVDSLFSGNTATADGGGIYIDHGTETIDHTTFTDNTTTGKGGGIVSFGSQTTITNSTFSGNSAHEGAGIMLFGNSHLSNSTFAANTGVGTNSVGGGANFSIFYGSIVLDNLTFVGNTATLGGGIAYTSGASELYIHNTIIVQSGSGGNCIPGSPAPHTSGADDLADDANCPNFTDLTHPLQNLNIGTLTDNGGNTQTFAVSLPSPALDSGSASCTGFDQRGVARGIDRVGGVNLPQSGDCDIGAFEAGGVIHTLQFAADKSVGIVGSMAHIPLTVDSAFAQGAPIKGYIWVSGGTAVVGVDYAPFGVQTVNITPGHTTASANITLLNNPPAVHKSIILSFATAHGPGFSGPAHLGTQLSHTVTIDVSAPNAVPARNHFIVDKPTLTWNRITWAARYEIRVANNDLFTGATTYDAGNNLSFTWPDSLINGTYFWRVRACTSALAASCKAWSDKDTFIIDAP